jgi:hypothetical protein
MNNWIKTCRARTSPSVVRLRHSPVPLALAVILLSLPARPQSTPSSQVSANELARRVITNEITFQDDHTNWMYRLEKERLERNGSRRLLRQKKVLSVKSYPLTTAPLARNSRRKRTGVFRS